MFMPVNKWVILLLAAVMALSAAACGARAEPEQNDAQKDEYAQQFMQELQNDILPHRNKADKLYEYGLMVSDDSGTLGLEFLGRFYEKRKAEEDSSVTIAFFNTTPLVIARLQFVGDAGYYFRYELNESQEIAVTCKYIDGVDILSHADTQTVDVSLLYQKNSVAVFSFSTAEDVQVA